MKKVADILAQKNRQLIAVSASTTVLDALKIMSDHNIGSILVNLDTMYLGLMTERDYARKVILQGKSSTDTIVAEIMSTDLPRVNYETSIEECMHLMSSNHIRYLPVFHEHHIVGIVSMNDVIKAVIANQADTISHLQTYIHS